jgi:hypothetical protein
MVIMAENPMDLLKDEWEKREGGGMSGSVVCRLVGSFEICLYCKAFLISYFLNCCLYFNPYPANVENRVNS